MLCQYYRVPCYVGANTHTWRLALVLPRSYSANCLDWPKDRKVKPTYHSEFPCHAFAHGKGFAPAASRRTRALVSVPFSGLQLPLPLLIIGLVSRYLTNYLIRCSLILRPNGSISPSLLPIKHSSIDGLSGVSHSFPWVFPS